MRSLMALHGFRMALAIAALLPSGVLPVASQSITPEDVKQAFRDHDIKAKVRSSDGLVEVRSEEFTFYVAVLPFTERFQFIGYLPFAPSTSPSEQIEMIARLNAGSPLVWDWMPQGLAKVSGYLPIRSIQSERDIVRAYAAFIVALAAGLAQSDGVIYPETHRL